MRIFVTGGAGFLGRHLVNALISRGDSVTIFDNFSVANPHSLEDIKDQVDIVKGSLASAEEVDKAIVQASPDAILHLGAVASTALALDHPTLTVSVNLVGTINVLEAIRKYEIPCGLSLSSEEAYGPYYYEPCDESHPLNPASAYGITKMAAEKYCDYYFTLHGLSMVSVRAGWVYGPGYPRTRIEVKVIRNAINGRKTIFPNGGDHRMDFIWVGDFVQGMLCLLDVPKLRYRIYNLASGMGYSAAQVVDVIRKLMPEVNAEIGPGLLEYIPGFPMPQKGALDIARIHSDTGYWPKVSIEQGLNLYIEHLLKEADT